MPGRSRSCASSSRDTASGHAAIVSAAPRYARILNAFSPLISSRSAISANTRAIGWLSTRETVALDAVVEEPRTAAGERVPDSRPLVRGPVAEEAPATACSADLRRRGAGRAGARDQIFNCRRDHAGREALPVLPFLGDRQADRVPVPAPECLAHPGCGVADPLEAVEHVA